MTSQLEYFIDNVYNNNDPRTSEWFLISRPGWLIAIVSLYVYFSVSAGPRLMENRAPYTLRTILIIYNFIQVLLSFYIVYEGLMVGWLFEFSFGCEPVDYSESPSAMRMARGAHLYFMCKIIELLDTVFFVLRKKNRQISFLHVYHHAAMPLAAWLAVRYFAGGHVSLIGVLNSFVHIFMYGYYMLAALGPQVQKYLWWKKYLTLLQLIQFLLIAVHNTQILFIGCNFPKSLLYAVNLQSAIFVYMFGSFYIQNYVKNNTSSAKVNGASSKNLKVD